MRTPAAWHRGAAIFTEPTTDRESFSGAWVASALVIAGAVIGTVPADLWSWHPALWVLSALAGALLSAAAASPFLTSLQRERTGTAASAVSSKD